MTASRQEIRRLTTGHPELDDVLSGGFPAPSINIFMGKPGTGKTILAQQILFHNAQGDRPAVFFSTLSEPLSKVLTYLQRFDFYDDERMSGDIVYQDLGEHLLTSGVDSVIDRIRQMIRELRPKLLVIDSFKAIHELAVDAGESRRLAGELGRLLSAFDVTTFLIGEYASDDVARYPEFAVADSVLELSYTAYHKWDQRTLRILKLRGSGYAQGEHSFVIDSGGIQLFPRLVAPERPPSYEAASGDHRLGSGVPGLDELTEGGMLRGGATMILGTAGTGKTTMGLGFALEGVRQGEASLYLNLQENPDQLSETVRRLGVDPDEYRSRGLHLQYVSPVELRIDQVMHVIGALLREHDIRRVVIDGLADLRLAAASGERFHDYVYSLVQFLKVRGVTTMMTMEAAQPASHGTTPGSGRVIFGLSTLCDALITLEIDASGEIPQRWLRIVKMRGTRHPLGRQPFMIGPQGLRVGEERGPEEEKLG